MSSGLPDNLPIDWDPRAICQRVGELCRQTGQWVLSQWENRSHSGVTDKATNSFVTEIDVACEQRLVQGLKQLIPEVLFLTEEGTESNNSSGNRWIIDPIDGTTNYMYGIPAYAISVALEIGGEVIIGIVYDIPHSELFSAVKGQGATLNGRRIAVNRCGVLRDALVATGFPTLDRPNHQARMQSLAAVLAQTRGVRRLGCAAIDLCYVASGRFDAFYEQGLQAWDIAAGALIAQEAGAAVRDYSGNAYQLDGQEIVSACPQIIQALTTLLRSGK